MQLTRKRTPRTSLKGLLATRHGAVALAVVCAIAAGSILVVALNQYRHTLSRGAKQSTVLVAAAQIPKGTSATLIVANHLYKVMPVVSTQLTRGALSDARSLSGTVAATTILPGQQLTFQDFTTSIGGVTPQLTPDERAVSLTLDPQHGLVGSIQTGDHVDIHSSLTSAAGVRLVTLIVPNAIVIKGWGGTNTGNQSASIVVGVDRQLVQKLMWVADYGKVWLVLRGLTSAAPPATVTGDAQVLLGNHVAGSNLTYTTPPASGGKK